MLIDTLTMIKNDDKERTRDFYLSSLCSLFVLRLFSKPTVRSRIYVALLCLLCKIRSGLNEFTFIKLGDENEGRSA